MLRQWRKNQCKQNQTNFSLLEDNEQDYIRMSSEKLYEDEPQNTGAAKGYTQVFKRVPDVNYSNSMTPRIRTNPKLWMTHDLLREVFKRDELFFKSKYKEPNNTELRQDYVRQRNKCNRLLVKAKNKYTKQLYYYGTHNLNETQLVHEVQNRRLSDVLNTILKHIKCPHCTRYYDDFKLKNRNRSRLTYKFPRARFMTRKTVTLRGGRNATILTATRHP